MPGRAGAPLRGLCAPAETGPGLVRLRHADAGACSYDGVEYLVDANGEVLVPAAAAAALAAHGFVPATPDKE